MAESGSGRKRRTLGALEDDFHLTQNTSEFFGLITKFSNMGGDKDLSYRWLTLAAPFGPSSLVTCSRACLGRSAAVRARALPNRNDMEAAGYGMRDWWRLVARAAARLSSPVGRRR